MFVWGLCKIPIVKVSSGPSTQSINFPATEFLCLSKISEDYLAVKLPHYTCSSTIFKWIWAKQMLIDTANSHSVSLCQHNTSSFPFPKDAEVSWEIKLHYSSKNKYINAKLYCWTPNHRVTDGVYQLLSVQFWGTLWNLSTFATLASICLAQGKCEWSG